MPRERSAHRRAAAEPGFAVIVDSDHPQLRPTPGSRRDASRRYERGHLAQWWFDRPVRVKGFAAVALPLIGLITIAVGSLLLQSRERSERAIAVQANAASHAAQAVLVDALDGETGIRAYAATGDANFLVPYARAQRDLATDLSALQSNAVDAAGRQKAATVAATAEADFRQLAAIRALAASGAGNADLVAPLEAGRTAMDSLRVELTDYSAAPAALTLEKRSAITSLEDRIRIVQIVGLILGVLAALAGTALLTSGISHRLRRAARNAERLGQGQVLDYVDPSADELGALAASMQRASDLLATRQEQLVAARDQAVEATHVKNTFLSRTSHELRTPLNAILGFAQLLGLSELSAADRESTTRILDAGRHLLALINDLIDTALIEAGELKLSVEPVGIETITEQVAELLRPLATAREISLEYRCEVADMAVYADVQRLRQVLVNLCSNAIKYNRTGGSIGILAEVGPGGQTVQIHVNDTGPGLSAEDIGRIFVPFERLEAGQHGIEGSGIGLPLALALTHAMRGDLNVASIPGEGSTFTITLPRAQLILDTTSGPTDRVLARTVVDPDPARLVQTLTVVSVEDNPANAQMLSRFFTRLPTAELHAATTAGEGLTLAASLTPDLILMDLHLPDMSGEEAMARLKAEPATARIPIVILSADATPGTIRRLISRGAFAYLTKPLNLAELHTVIDSAMSSRRSNAPTVGTSTETAPRS